MKKTLIFLFFAGTIGMIFIMSDTGKTLSQPAATPHGILHLELAYNKASTDTIMKAWETGGSGMIDNIAAAKNNTHWDFVFLFFYGGFLFLFCRQLAGSFNGFLKKAGNIFAVAALLAALLDVGENIGMLQTLSGKGSDSIAMFTAICSGIKWVLVLLSILYALVAGAGWIYKKFSGRS